MSTMRRIKTPTCTHTTMDRVYGREQLCDVCGRIPGLGFLYACREDKHQAAVTGEAVSPFFAPAKILTLGRRLTRTKAALPCAMKACHTCRPYFKDRIFIALEAVMAGDFEPITPHEVGFVLPVKSADIMSRVGLQPVPISHETSPSVLSPTSAFSADTDLDDTVDSTLTFKTTQTDTDQIAAMRSPRRHFYSLGHRSSGDLVMHPNRLPILTRSGAKLRAALKDMFCNPRRDESSDGSAIEVDDGAAVEVDGGVALTEEAIETHTPDVLSVLAQR
ncbi:hypothetical protein BS50DRAFT_635594 [Corynespora cassiicola Philippines]|uniref:Uncharacterized protein n=1 Tax=Corynespora cassiicola Philippines TaxID=1448308 RepID=A0A2T2NM73_CORCC|nr:hypothetical protein BS50DRAFT_635594 [Corynespora cassiicola Philippines]